MVFLNIPLAVNEKTVGGESQEPFETSAPIPNLSSPFLVINWMPRS
jgi:hypothetical protein